MTAGRRRVLFVGAFPPPASPVFGGMVTSCRVLMEAGLPELLDLRLLDSTQISNPPPSLWTRGVLAARRLARYVYFFEKSRPEAVLLFVAVGASILEKGAMAWYARFRKVPAIMFPRGGAIFGLRDASMLTRFWVRTAFRGASRIWCQEKMWQDFVVHDLGRDRRVAPIVRNWTATPELLVVGARRMERMPVRGAEARLLFVGWVEQDKGIFELLEACHRLKRTHNFTLTVVGEGRASDEAKARVVRYGLQEIVRFRGRLDAAEVESELYDGDIFVLPSWAEGLPNAMIEAMAAGLAVVVSRVGAVPDVIEEGRSGLMVEPRDANSLERVLARVMDDSALRECLGREAHAVATDKFSGQRAAASVAMEVERAIEEFRHAGATAGRSNRVGD